MWNFLLSDYPAEIWREVSELPGAQRKPSPASLSSQGAVWGVLYEYQRVSNMPGSNYHPAVTLEDDVQRTDAASVCVFECSASRRVWVYSSCSVGRRPARQVPSCGHGACAGQPTHLGADTPSVTACRLGCRICELAGLCWYSLLAVEWFDAVGTKQLSSLIHQETVLMYWKEQKRLH